MQYDYGQGDGGPHYGPIIAFGFISFIIAIFIGLIFPYLRTGCFLWCDVQRTVVTKTIEKGVDVAIDQVVKPALRRGASEQPGKTIEVPHTKRAEAEPKPNMTIRWLKSSACPIDTKARLKAVREEKYAEEVVALEAIDHMVNCGQFGDALEVVTYMESDSHKTAPLGRIIREAVKNGKHSLARTALDFAPSDDSRSELRKILDRATKLRYAVEADGPTATRSNGNTAPRVSEGAWADDPQPGQEIDWGQELPGRIPAPAARPNWELKRESSGAKQPQFKTFQQLVEEDARQDAAMAREQCRGKRHGEFVRIERGGFGVWCVDVEDTAARHNLPSRWSAR